MIQDEYILWKRCTLRTVEANGAFRPVGEELPKSTRKWPRDDLIHSALLCSRYSGYRRSVWAFDRVDEMSEAQVLVRGAAASHSRILVTQRLATTRCHLAKHRWTRLCLIAYLFSCNRSLIPFEVFTRLEQLIVITLWARASSSITRRRLWARLFTLSQLNT